MVVTKKKQRKIFSKFLGDRRGTAEIVGTVMFLVILLFVFTNVYLWHDNVTREMNGVLAEKMNSPVTLELYFDVTENLAGLTITNNGGFEAGLSRLWINTVTQHSPINLDLRVAPGATLHLLFENLGVSVPNQRTTFKIVTTLGNMAACSYNP
jgi:hypothetical protein